MTAWSHLPIPFGVCVMAAAIALVLVSALVIVACGGGAATTLVEGDAAPGFALPADDGSIVRLDQFRGVSPVVLYFYPKDQTPGCTKQACGFRDALDEYRRRGVAVLGISVDSVEAHAEFRRKENLNFPLLSDRSKEVSRAYGVLNNLGLARRVTFVVDREGRIARILRDFDPAGNARQVLDVVDATALGTPGAAAPRTDTPPQV